MATRRVGVGPGVKMELKRLVMKSAMFADDLVRPVRYLLSAVKYLKALRCLRGVRRHFSGL